MEKKQRYNIPLETLMEAKKCSKHHACLTDEAYQLCGIKLSSEHHARLVCGRGADCPYSSSLGNKVVCTCPVRHEIFRKYGV
jgi:hypothetical protein